MAESMRLALGVVGSFSLPGETSGACVFWWGEHILETWTSDDAEL